MGRTGSLKEMMSLLKKADEPLWTHLKLNNVKPQFYGIRWLSLLLSQAHPLHCRLRHTHCTAVSGTPTALVSQAHPLHCPLRQR